MYDTAAVLQFVNTCLDRPSGTVEHLPDAGTARDWLTRELGWAADAALTRREYLRLLSLRDCLRRLLRNRIANRPLAPQDVATLNRHSAAVPRYRALTPTGQAATLPAGPSPPAPAALLRSELAEAGVELLADAGVDLAECGAPDCVMLFARTDPRRQWHDDRCGNRVRAARSYQRRHATS